MVLYHVLRNGILFILVIAVLSAAQHGNYTHPVQRDYVEKSGERLVSRALQASSLHRAVLDRSVLGKSIHLVAPSGSRGARPLQMPFLHSPHSDRKPREYTVQHVPQPRSEQQLRQLLRAIPIEYTEADEAEMQRIASVTGKVMKMWTDLKPEFDSHYSTLKGNLSGKMQHDVLPLFHHLYDKSDAFRDWHDELYRKQDDLWAFAMRATHRNAVRVQGQYKALVATGNTTGSLRLDPSFSPPKYLTQSEGFHRMPGGYCSDRDGTDLRAGLLYDTGNDCFFKGLAGLFKNPAIADPATLGKHLIWYLEREFPQQWARWTHGEVPIRILDIGCATGLSTLAWKERFPAAEVHGIDVGAGLLRFAHLQAEAKGLQVHYSQQDAARLVGFSNNSVDLIVSHILFHEVSPEYIPEVFAECRRILRPGGVMINLDVSNQDWREGGEEAHSQFREHWQTYFNGEPYWSSHASARINEIALQNGVKLTLHKQAPKPQGQGEWYIFGFEK